MCIRDSIDGLDDLFLVALQLPFCRGMEFFQIGHRTVCQLEFFLPLLLDELAPGCGLYPLKELDDNLINNAVEFLTGVPGLTVTVLRMADLVVAGVANTGFPLGLTLGASAAAGGQHLSLIHIWKTAELFYIHYKRTAGICLLDKLNNYMRTSRGGNHWEFTNAGV